MVATDSAPLSARYEVPAIVTEVAPQEGLLHAFDSLQTLDAVINDVFTRITSRIGEERTKIQNVVSRITHAQSKVAQISANTNRATSIFSTAKYPAPKVLADFRRVISPVDEKSELPAENKGFFVKPTRTSHRIAAEHRFAPAPPADTSAIYTTLTRSRLLRTEHASTDEATEMAEGLGRLPSYLPSISSVLLFNSDENPYKQYVTINNLEGVGGQDRQQDAAGPSAAPKSIMDGLELPTYAGFQFEYKPLLGDMPTFDLPANLPLGKLADITFGSDNMPSASIAPSMAGLVLPDLNLPNLPIPMQTRQQVISAVPASAIVTPSAKSASSSVPIPPAPSSSASAASAAAPVAPPIAPPVSTALVPVAPPPTAPTAPQGVPAAVAKPAGGRSALLDSIRDAKNQKRLRSVGASGSGRPTGGKVVSGGAGRKTSNADAAGAGGDGGEAPAEKKKAPASDSGDIMAALRASIERRAAAMAGKGEVDKPGLGARQPSIARSAPQRSTPPAFLAKARAAAATKSDAIAEGDDEKSENMSTAVLSAYVSAHQKKQEKDEAWE